MKYIKANRIAASKLELFVVSTTGLILLGLWAFFEASFWFIAPDFLIGLYCFLAPKKYKKIIFTTLVISLIGGFAYYLFILNNFGLSTQILDKTPFISDKNFNFVKDIYLEKGVIATFLQSITLIPFKIWTYHITLYNFNPLIYFILVGISRAFRFILVGLIAVYLRKKMENIGKNHLIPLVVLYTLLFLLVTSILE